MSTIFRVAPENITGLWPQLAPLVNQGLRGVATHDVEDVRRCLFMPTCQLWGQFDIPTLEAIVISEFVSYPKGVWLRAWIAAALPEPGMETEEFLALLTAFARENNCRGFEAAGRHGWMRRVPEATVDGLLMRVNFQ